MGTFITLSGVNPGVDYPRVDVVDAILPTTGALYLFEPAHPASAFAAGVPVNGQSLRNVARDQAATLLGTSTTNTDTTLAVTAAVAGSSILERTGKGGIHSIHSLTQTPSGGISVPIPVAILDYLAANIGHSIYLSTWGRITRSPTAANDAQVAVSFTASNGGYLASIAQNTSYGVALGSRRSPAGTWVGAAAAPLFASVGSNAYNGTPGATRQGKAMGVRTGVPFSGSTAVAAQQRSGVLYRAYMEDLTVSGRSYATVDALDYAMFTAQVVNPGGRYYGDTFTAPSTLP